MLLPKLYKGAVAFVIRDQCLGFTYKFYNMASEKESLGLRAWFEVVSPARAIPSTLLVVSKFSCCGPALVSNKAILLNAKLFDSPGMRVLP